MGWEIQGKNKQQTPGAAHEQTQHLQGLLVFAVSPSDTPSFWCLVQLGAGCSPLSRALVGTAGNGMSSLRAADQPCSGARGSTEAVC